MSTGHVVRRHGHGVDSHKPPVRAEGQGKATVRGYKVRVNESGTCVVEGSEKREELEEGVSGRKGLEANDSGSACRVCVFHYLLPE